MRAGGLSVGLSAKGRAVEAEASSSLAEDIVRAACYTVVALAGDLGLQSNGRRVAAGEKGRGGGERRGSVLDGGGRSLGRKLQDDARVVGSCPVVLNPGKAPRLSAPNRGEQQSKFAQPAETTGSALNVRIRRSLPRKGQDMHRLLCTSRRQ